MPSEDFYAEKVFIAQVISSSLITDSKFFKRVGCIGFKGGSDLLAGNYMRTRNSEVSRANFNEEKKGGLHNFGGRILLVSQNCYPAASTYAYSRS